MNTRILELAEEAGFQWTKFGLVATPASSAAYFAELVVRECAKLTRWEEYEMSVEQRIRLEVAQEIKEHFGVKD